MPKLDYSPIILIQDTAKLTREEWLEARRQRRGNRHGGKPVENKGRPVFRQARPCAGHRR